MQLVTFSLKCTNTRHSIRIEPGQSLVVGRKPGVADVQLPNAAVSRRHLRLTNEGGRLILEDLLARGGTYVNGVQIALGQSHELVPGDHIEFCGEFCFVLEIELANGKQTL